MRRVSAGVLALMAVLPFAPAAHGAAPSRPSAKAAHGAAPSRPSAKAPPAYAGAAPRPLDELVAARGALAALAARTRSSAARRSVLAAAGAIRRATASTLWLDPGHVVAPGYGLSVFGDSRAALVSLEHIAPSALASGTLSAIEKRVLAGDRAVSEGAIVQALGGSGGLLARADGMVLSGDRWAQTSRLDLAAEQYGTGWNDAFQALTQLVMLRATSVPQAAVGAAAARALRGTAIEPAGVRFVRGRRLLDVSGRPEVLFVGTTSCRFCAAESWGLVVALSRFGTFSNLRLSESETTAPPVVRSFTFAGARYQSPYLSFASVELSGERPTGGGFAPLERLTAAQRALFRALDPTAVVPFVDVANRTREVGATVSPRLVAGASWGAVSASLRNPRAASGEAIDAMAEVLSAEICRATGGQPSSVCSGTVVQEYSRRLARFAQNARGRGSGCAVAAGAAAEAGAGAAGRGAGPPRHRGYFTRTVTPASR